jgi:hypothetical protein
LRFTPNPKGPPLFDNGALIYRYSRADAIRDGVLIDVSEMAREAGGRLPVALTQAGWERCVAVPPGGAHSAAGSRGRELRDGRAFR